MTRRQFNPSPHIEFGRHESYEHRPEGKYFFKRYQGGRGIAEKLAAYKEITRELQEIIADCVAEDKELRAQGSSWSLSQVGLARDRHLNSKLLRLLRFSIPQSEVAQGYTRDHTKLMFLECGESVSVINQMLFRNGLSLKTSGSNNGQTLVGALSTGTHGSAFDFGAIPDFVVGLHLVVGPTKHVYLQRASDPVVGSGFANSLGATFLEDDDLFNAALVSFGAFGIIQGVMIETRELFALHATRFFHPYDQGLQNAISSLDFSGIDLSRSRLPTSAPRDRLHHFQVFFNPNEGLPPERASLLMMFEEDWANVRQGYVPPEWDDGDPGPSASGLELVGAIYPNLPPILNQLVLPILNAQVEEQLGPFYRLGLIKDLVRGEPVEGKLFISGTAIPMERALEAQKVAFDTYRDLGKILPVIISSRFIKGGDALLGFTKFERNCTVEIDTINTPEALDFLNRFRNNLEQAGIPFTVHWGKLDSFLTPSRLRNIYGADLDRWLASRTALLENDAVKRVFTNEFMRELELV